MKQAYLITAYKDFGSLYELAEIFTKTGFVYIHVDKKSRTITDEDVEKLNRLPGCRAIREYSIVWGGFAHVQAILKLLMMASSNPEVSYIHLLTGEDYPLVPVEKLDEMFLSSDRIYMSYMKPDELPETVTVRYRYYNWFRDKNVKNKLLWTLQNLTVKLQKAMGICRKGIGEFDASRIYKGLVYISMPKEAAGYVISYVSGHESFWEDLKKCQVPEEFFFQTIFMNAPAWKDHVVKRELRYMDWSKGDGSSPSYLDQRDYDKVMQAKAQGCLFARKFHPQKSEPLRRRIREEQNEARR